MPANELSFRSNHFTATSTVYIRYCSGSKRPTYPTFFAVYFSFFLLFNTENDVLLILLKKKDSKIFLPGIGNFLIILS